MKKILVPVEPNSNDEEIIKEAVEMAKNFDTTIVLLQVNNSKEALKEVDYGGFIEEDRMYEKFKDTSFSEKIKKLYEAEGVKAEILIAEGDPAEKILEESKNEEYDLLIMRTHTMKKRSRFLLGSVTNKVVHHIEIPVLVVR
jgi:nucleotide-binding universal stress UspA family protein